MVNLPYKSAIRAKPKTKYENHAVLCISHIGPVSPSARGTEYYFIVSLSMIDYKSNMALNSVSLEADKAIW